MKRLLTTAVLLLASASSLATNYIEEEVCHDLSIQMNQVINSDEANYQIVLETPGIIQHWKDENAKCALLDPLCQDFTALQAQNAYDRGQRAAQDSYTKEADLASIKMELDRYNCDEFFTSNKPGG